MYTEETKTTINWSSVIKKGIVILLVALVIFFIIWLVARNNESTYRDIDIFMILLKNIT